MRSPAGAFAPGNDSSTRFDSILRLRDETNGDGMPVTIKALHSVFLRHVLLDLANQGWEISLNRAYVTLRPGDTLGERPEAAKQRIRKQHLQERDAQLRESSVRDFVR